MTLTKADLVQQIYKAHPNLTKSQSTDSVETFLSLSKSSLITGNDLANSTSRIKNPGVVAIRKQAAN
jgi:nucleoid DNA-binding protein